MSKNYKRQFEVAEPHAKALLDSKDTGKLDDLLEKAEKAKNITDALITVKNMIKDYSDGTYRQVPEATIIMLIGAIVYFVAPDLIPGPIDDAALITWAITAAAEDIAKYSEWKSKQEGGKEPEQVNTGAVAKLVVGTKNFVSDTIHSIKVGDFIFDVRSKDDVVKKVKTKYKKKLEDVGENAVQPEEGVLEFLSNFFRDVKHVAGLIAEAIDISSMGLDVQFNQDKMKATVAGKHKYSVLDIDELQFFVAKGKHTLVWKPGKNKEEGIKTKAETVVG